MTLPEVKKLRLASIVLPGNFAATRAASRIGDLAASMEEHGVFSLPVVSRVGDEWKLIAGHDRVAALMRVKAKDALCIVVAGDERSLRRLSVAENLYRRHDDKAELLASLDDEEREVVQERDAQLSDTRRLTPAAGRPKTTRGAAREEVAKLTARNPRSIARADQRAAKAKAIPAGESAERSTIAADEKQANNGAPGAGGEPGAVAIEGFETFGADLTPDYFDGVRSVMAILGKADQLLRQAQGLVTGLRNERMPGALQQRLKEAVHHAAASMRMARPIMVCPWCKGRGVADKRSLCIPCGTHGWIPEEMRGGVPKELLQPGVVAVNGKFVATTVKDADRPGVYHVGLNPPLKTIKSLKVKITGPDGSEADFEPAEDTQ